MEDLENIQDGFLETDSEDFEVEDDEKYGTDLFPRDFIYRSPRADQYIGAREFCG